MTHPTSTHPTKNMETSNILQQHCHEYRCLGDLQPSYGFGATPEEAREDAVYGSDRPDDSARDHYLGFGDWRIQIDEENSMWVTKINKSTPS